MVMAVQVVLEEGDRITHIQMQVKVHQAKGMQVVLELLEQVQVEEVEQVLLVLQVLLLLLAMAVLVLLQL